MSMSAINIYSVPQVAQLTVAGVNAGARMITNSAYNRSTFRLYRRVQNVFNFLVRDVDRQPVVLTGDLVFQVWDDKANLIIEKTMDIVNAAYAQYTLTFTAAETIAIYSGIYVWAVTNVNNPVVSLLYTNSDYGSRGILEVHEGLLVAPADPYVILSSDLTPDQFLGLYSSAFPGAALAENPAGNHTLLASLDGFTGSIIVQATLDEQPPAGVEGWVNVSQTDYSAETSTAVINFDGNFTYVRFLASSSQGLVNLTYRN